LREKNGKKEDLEKEKVAWRWEIKGAPARERLLTQYTPSSKG